MKLLKAIWVSIILCFLSGYSFGQSIPPSNQKLPADTGAMKFVNMLQDTIQGNKVVNENLQQEMLDKKLNPLFDKKSLYQGSGISKDIEFERNNPENQKINFEIINKGNDILENIAKDVEKAYSQQNLLKSRDSIGIFGLDYLRNSNQKIFQSATDVKAADDYIIGSGDIINIVIWGYTDYNQVFEIEKDGYFQPQFIGKIYLKGVTFKKAKEIIANRYSQFYNLNGSQIDITLVYSRVINVNIVGEVEQPGTYSVPALNSAYNILSYVGGPTKIGSVRNIQIKRNGEIVKRFDLYKYLLEPDKVGNIYLENNDYLYVPPAKKLVKIYGEVMRPAIYELLENEAFEDLITYAAGFKANAFTGSIQIKRYVNDKAVLLDVNLDSIRKIKGRVPLLNGDEIFVRQIPEGIKNYVNVVGAVLMPGDYEFVEGERVTDVIAKAQGLKDDVYLDVAYLTRTNDDYSKDIFKINLKEILQNPASSNNLSLVRRDKLEVFSSSYFTDLSGISVKGAVRNPRVFPMQESLTLRDVILLSGGLQPSAYLERAYITRTNKANNTVSYIPVKLDTSNQLLALNKITLQENDEVNILSNLSFQLENVVSIAGSVRNAGIFELWKDLSLRDLLLLCGGVNESAYLNKGFIYRLKPDQSKEVISFSLDPDNNFGNLADIKLQRKDHVVIFSNAQFLEYFNVKTFGAVKQAGTYSYTDNMTLADVLTLSGGLKLEAAVNRVEISRISNFEESVMESTPTKIKIEILKIGQDYASDAVATSYKLSPYDQIFVRSIPEFDLQKNVVLVGEVTYPGEYSLETKNDKLAAIIERAGGLTAYAFPEGAKVIRKEDNIGRIVMDLNMALRRKKSKYNFVLKEGDTIIIPTVKNVVTIMGATQYTYDKLRMDDPNKGLNYLSHDSLVYYLDSTMNVDILRSNKVNFPDNTIKVPYIGRRNASYYVKKYAAGYHSLSRKKDTYVLYQNGEIKDTRFIFIKRMFPRVESGATIVVPQKMPKKTKNEIQHVSGSPGKQKKRFDFLAFFQSTVATTASVLTLYFLIKNSKD